jgi:hypothetical protein
MGLGTIGFGFGSAIAFVDGFGSAIGFVGMGFGGVIVFVDGVEVTHHPYH